MPNTAPIWARPEPGSRRPRFTREQLAAAALAIADAEGFDAVSMRRVATELGAGTMTLYHYVRTKDDLVALMDDAIMTEVLIPDGELPTRWRAALTAIAHRTREVLMRHPWALHSLRDARMGPNAMRHAEQSFAALAHTDLDAAGKVTLVGMVDDYVHGNASRTAELRARAADGDPSVDFVRTQLRTGGYPHLQAVFGSGAMDRITGPVAEQQRFERGLQALLDGATVLMGLPRE